MPFDYEQEVAAARACSRCGRDFSPEERYLSALFEQGEGFQRLDYCAGCWEGPPTGSFAHWRGRVPAKEERPPRFVDDGELVELFVRLGGAGEPREVAFRYLLGLLLVRKRLLRLVRSGGAGARQPDAGGESMVVEDPGGGARYEAAFPMLTASELATVSAQMGAVLRVNVHGQDVQEQPEEKKEAGGDV
jgi:hypothetical protein